MLPDPCHTYICYCVIQSVLPLHYRHCLGRRLSTWLTRSIWKVLGPFATTSRLTPIHQVSPLYCRTPPVHRCPQRRRRQRQRVTEGTAMAPWNGPNDCCLMSDSLRRAALCCQLMFWLAWCRTHSAATATELLQQLVLDCGTPFLSSRVIQTCPMNCSNDGWKDTSLWMHEHGILWPLICGALEKHLHTYLLTINTKTYSTKLFMIGQIPWGHSGPLCHALSS